MGRLFAEHGIFSALQPLHPLPMPSDAGELRPVPPDRRFHDRAVVGVPSGAVDRLLVAASRAADYSVLWLVLSAGLSVIVGPRGRRAALRGLLALVMTSAVVNGPIKWVVRRPRPAYRRRAALRRLRSSSFPSGHSASAFAFATAVTCELPAAGPLVLPLAVLVAYSRAYLGVHYPSDVLFGAAIGATAGLAASSRLSTTTASGPRTSGLRASQQR